MARVRLVAPSARDLVMNRGRRVTGMNMYEPYLAYVAFCSSARYARSRADRHRQTERQRQTERVRESQRQTETETDTDRHRQTDGRTDGQTARQTDRQTPAPKP